MAERMPFGPLPPQELRAYEPSLRDRLAQWFMGDERASPEKERLISGMFGSIGLGNTGMGLVDLTPAGAPLAVDEYKRAQTPADAAFAAMSFIPGAKPAAAAAKGVASAADEAVKGIRAYHASPHDFDRFDFSKVGTGEGSQVYGHGGYFSESEAVSGRGGHYDKQFSGRFPRRYPDEASALAEAGPGGSSFQLSDDEWYARGADGKFISDEQRARIYEVKINADPEQFLDWDKPLSQQSEAVRSALSNIPWAEDYLKSSAFTGGQIVPRTQQGTQQMKDAGVPGIKYLDQGSRGAGDGSRNYVVFDDALVEILKKYGIALPFGLGAAGAGALGQNEPEVY